ncbi:tetratricopeptide repeat protein [Maricaulis sp. CAU 1757]
MRPIASLALFAAIATGGSASGQIIVFGESSASSCYQHALTQRSDNRAIRDCDTALAYPDLNRRDRAATYANRGIVRLYRNQAEAALEDFDFAERQGLQEPAALAVNRSSAYYRLARYQEALAAADAAIAANQDNLAEAWFNRAVTLEALGDLAGAYDAYSQAQAVRPDWPLPARELRRFQVRPGS